MINTVLGHVDENEIKTVLSHEHICCYSEYLQKMSKNKIGKEKILKVAVDELKRLKQAYEVNLFVDCTPVNIGRDIELLKAVSYESGVHIVCSTGFYYTEEIILYDTPVETLVEYYLDDVKSINAGVIKAAVEMESLSALNEKFLIASAKTQLETELPIILHTNAKNKNAPKALDILFNQGIKPSCITVAHLSDTEDVEYILEIAEKGCYIGLDRLYSNVSDSYITRKLNTINKLVDAGFVDKIILSHDELMYNGFNSDPQIKTHPRYSYVFDNILCRLQRDVAEKIIRKNPIRMLKCE